MTKRITTVSFIYLCCCVAWMVLGGTVSQRTLSQDDEMHREVGRLWGGEQIQSAPTVTRLGTVQERVTRPTADATEAAAPAGSITAANRDETPVETETVTVSREVTYPHTLSRSRVSADLSLEHRRKGLLWYPTYGVAFGGAYAFENDTEDAATYRFRFRLPDAAAVFGDVVLEVDGDPVEAAVENGALTHDMEMEPGDAALVRVGYTSGGTGAWRYELASDGATGTTGVATIRDFALVMTTDFRDIDFPGGTLSPTTKKRTEAGWRLAWDQGTLVTDAAIGMAMPQKLNPGPWVSRVTFFAPVSLFLFFFVVFVMTMLRGVRLHPMHYFFLGASFFAFHLLLAYLVDHVSVGVAMAAASVVSLALVISYVRLVAGLRFALVEVGGAQLVYLVGFASTFFLEGFTGLSVTLLSIATLFVVMQATGRVDWEALLARPEAETKPRVRQPAPRMAAE